MTTFVYYHLAICGGVEGGGVRGEGRGCDVRRP